MQNFSQLGDMTPEYSHYKSDDKSKNLLNLLGYYNYNENANKKSIIYHSNL